MDFGAKLAVVGLLLGCVAILGGTISWAADGLTIWDRLRGPEESEPLPRQPGWWELCPGGEVDDSPYFVRDSAGRVLSRLHLYYQQVTGKNCAVNETDSSAQSVEIGVRLEVCAEATPGPSCTVTDTTSAISHSADYHAGPVILHGAQHCVRVYGSVTDRSSDRLLGEYLSQAFHCG